jgi:hypothetical protein
MIWIDDVTRTGKLRNTYKISVGKPEGKSPLGRLRHRWEDNNSRGAKEL